MVNDLKQRAYEEERSENFGRAIELYRSVIDHREADGLTHQDASMFVRIADLHLRRDERSEAIEAFQRAGELYAREGLQPQAIAIYRRILRIAQEHTEALWNLAWLHAEMGVMAEARQYVADYLETVDLERDWVEARDFLRRLLDLSDDTAIGIRLAELLEEADRHDEALGVLDRLDVEVGAGSGLDAGEVRERIESVRDEVGLDPAVGELEGEPEGSDFGGDAVDDARGGEAAGDDTAPYADGSEREEPAERAGASARGDGWDDAADEGVDSEFDIEVGEDEAGSLEDAFPFPDDEGHEAGDFENGDLQDEAFGGDDVPPGAFEETAPPGEAGRPDAEAEDGDELGEDERPAAGFEQPSPWQEESARAEERAEEQKDAAEQEAAPEREETASPKRETKEEQMSAQSEDTYGGSAVEADEGRESAAPEGPASGTDGPGAQRDAGGGFRAATEEHEEYEEYGERAELRRGLEVLDELIELDPGRLDHYRRRIGYADRLGDDDERIDSHVQLATALRRRDSSRAARLVYERLLRTDAGTGRAREGIEELNREAREELGVPEPFPGSGVTPPGDSGAGRSELARRVWPELDRAIGQVQWLQGAAELLQEQDHAGAAGGPPVDACELVGRYYLTRGDVDDAIDVLSLALEREDLDDSALVDVLFQLGLSHYRIDDRGSAQKYFDRVASQDEDFRTVCGWILSES